MKTLFKSILVLAVMFGTSASYANEVINVKNAFNNVEEGNQISVSDASGEVVYSGRINFSGNIKNLFDFSELNDGVYTVEINKDYEIEINTIEVKKHIVTYSENLSETIFKPVFRTEDSKIIVSKLAFNNEEMSIELYFGNDLIHSETLKGGEILNRVYKLDQNLKGDYTAVITTNNRVFVEDFRI